MRALIVVDVQNDFLPGGALAVSNGDEVIPVVNQLLAKKETAFDVIVATQDWHPKNHGSFASNNPGKHVGEIGRLAGLDQIMWPDHCIQESRGAEFAKELDLKAIDRVFRKGTDPTIDSYSGFFDNQKRKSTGMGEYLKSLGVDEVVILGLATDYCVKFTCLDAVGMGLKTTVLIDGSRAVNLKPTDEEGAIAEMRGMGIEVTTSGEFLSKAALHAGSTDKKHLSTK